MSYAVVKVGGKQYRVEEGQSILVDRMRADEGDKVDLQPLLFADGDKSVLDSGELGKVTVQAVVTGHERGKKIHGLKFKPKRGYKRRYGARSHLTRLEISSIKSRKHEEEVRWLIRKVWDQAAMAATPTPSAWA